MEGMAAGPAVERRWGRRGEELGDLLPEVLDLEARILASGFRNIVYTLAPERIILGGGLGSLPGLASAVGRYLLEEMAAYAVQPEHNTCYVVPPGLGGDAGLAGALALAMSALTSTAPPAG